MTNPKPPRIPIEPLRWAASDPLATEHELVSRLVSETLKTDWLGYTDLDLNLIEPGRTILQAEPEAGARIAMALVANAAHYDNLTRKVKALSNDEMERMNWHNSPEFKLIWPARRICSEALNRIMRRKLPLGAEHLTKLADWISSAEWLTDSFYPLKAFVKAVEAYGAIDPQESALRSSVERVARLLRSSHQKDLPKLSQQIETVLGGAAAATAELSSQPQEFSKSPYPDPFIPAAVARQTFWFN